MSPRKRVILLMGGVFHAILVLQGLIGVFTVVVALRARYWEIERESIDDGLWLAATLIVAVAFGWFCMRLVGVTHPWRAELRALAVYASLTVLIGIVSTFVLYPVRADYPAASAWQVCLLVVVLLLGAISFYLIGRRQVLRSTSSEATQVAMVT